MSNPVVFFDMTIGGAPAGRIEMTLRADVVPKTAEVRAAPKLEPACQARPPAGLTCGCQPVRATLGEPAASTAATRRSLIAPPQSPCSATRPHA